MDGDVDGAPLIVGEIPECTDHADSAGISTITTPVGISPKPEGPLGSDDIKTPLSEFVTPERLKILQDLYHVCRRLLKLPSLPGFQDETTNIHATFEHISMMYEKCLISPPFVASAFYYKFTGMTNLLNDLVTAPSIYLLNEFINYFETDGEKIRANCNNPVLLTNAISNVVSNVSLTGASSVSHTCVSDVSYNGVSNISYNSVSDVSHNGVSNVSYSGVVPNNNAVLPVKNLPITVLHSNDPPKCTYASTKKQKISKSKAQNLTHPNDSDDRSDEFRQPRKPAKPMKIVPMNPILPTGNKFNPLNDIEIMDDSEAVEQTNDQQITPPKQPKIEPIFMKMTENWRTILDNLTKSVGSEIKKKVTGELLKLMPHDIGQFRAIQKYLADNKHQFFGMRLKNERPRKIIIKGIPRDIHVDEVKNDLLAMGFQVNRVSQLRDFKTKVPFPIFLCDIFPNDHFKFIFEVTTVLGFVVKVDTYSFKGVKQCYRCQKFNHSSDNCTLKITCLKCAGNHRASECSINDPSAFKCANCNGNHTANFRGCPMTPANIRAQKEQIKTFKSATIKEGVSFSAMAKGQTTEKTPSTNKDLSAKTLAQKALEDAASWPELPQKTKTATPATANQIPPTTNFTTATIPDGNITTFPIDQYDAVINKLQTIVTLLERINDLSKTISENPTLAPLLGQMGSQLSFPTGKN